MTGNRLATIRSELPASTRMDSVRRESGRGVLSPGAAALSVLIRVLMEAGVTVTDLHQNTVHERYSGTATVVT